MMNLMDLARAGGASNAHWDKYPKQMRPGASPEPISPVSVGSAPARFPAQSNPAQNRVAASPSLFSVGGGWLDWRHPKGGF